MAMNDDLNRDWLTARKSLNNAFKLTKPRLVAETCKDLRERASSLLRQHKAQSPEGLKAQIAEMKGLCSQLLVASRESRQQLAARRKEEDKRLAAAQQKQAREWEKVLHWYPHAKRILQSELRKRGYRREHTSEFGSSYYKRWNEARNRYETVRIANHVLPQTPERDYNDELHGHSKYKAEFVLDRIMSDAALREWAKEVLDGDEEIEQCSEN